MKSGVQVLGSRYAVTAMLGAGIVACLGLIGFETDWGRAAGGTTGGLTSSSRTSEMTATLPPFSLASLDSAYKETGERPLFLPTRRPIVVSQANVVVMKKGQFKLAGTSVNNELSVAYLVETATGKTIRVSKGEGVKREEGESGIKVAIVEANRVVLKQGDDSEELTLRTAASPARPVTPPGTPGTQGTAGAQGSAAGPGAAQGNAVATAGAAPPVPTAPNFPPPGVAQVQTEAPRPQMPVTVQLNNNGAGAQASVPAADPAAAQRRRRFQNAPQQ